MRCELHAGRAVSICVLPQVFDCRGEVTHFVDASHESLRSWITYVQCARVDAEQNLELLQVGADIFYRAIKVCNNFVSTQCTLHKRGCRQPALGKLKTRQVP